MLALAIPAAAHAACNEFSSPTTISAPGQYCLTADITTNIVSGNTITINANDVVLDCQNHTLRSTAASNGGTSTAIYFNSHNNIVIRNCRIIGGYTSGIQASQANTVPNKNYYITLQDNYIAGPFQYGILAFGSGIEITGNRIYDIGGQANSPAFGIRLGAYSTGFKFHVVRDNLIAGTNSPDSNAFGIFSDGTVAGIFAHNVISGFTSGNTAYRGYGIRLSGTENQITDNHINGGNATGYGVYTPAGNWCYDNYLRTANRTVGCDASLGNF